MAYSKTTWVDGTTPVNASNLNKIENGLSDVSETADSLSEQLGTIQISASGDNNSTGIILANGGTLTFSGTLAMIFCQYSNVNYAYAAMFRNGYVMPFVQGSNAAITASADGTTYTVTNNASTGYRYFLFIRP